jgi:hypothetical protein
MIDLGMAAHAVHAFAPIIPFILAGAQLAEGIAQGGKAKRESAAADAARRNIPAEDPGVRRMADEIRQRRINAELGQTSMLGYKRRMAEEAGRNMGDNLVRAVGTSPGATQQALLRGQGVTQDALMRAGAETESMVPRYMAMETPLIQDIADRKLKTQDYVADKMDFQAAQDRQNSNNAITAATGILSGIDFNGWKKEGTTPSFDRSPVQVTNYRMNVPMDNSRQPVTSPNGSGLKPVTGIGDPGTTNYPWVQWGG